MTLLTGILTKNKEAKVGEQGNHYFSSLGLQKDPFSTSPDPDFFYPASQYHSTLRDLEISIRLRRGASVVLGDIGVGKTTLCRRLLSNLGGESFIEPHLLLNPHPRNEVNFYEYLLHVFVPDKKGPTGSAFDQVRDYLFEQSIERKKTIVLIVDEAQKLTRESIEALRLLLNFETNDFKMLQLVLFGQMELRPLLASMPNFVDRLSMKRVLNPLEYKEFKELILFRLRKGGLGRGNIFSEDGMRLIFEATQGFPRKVCMIAHRCLEKLIYLGRKRVDAKLVLQVLDEELVF